MISYLKRHATKIIIALFLLIFNTKLAYGVRHRANQEANDPRIVREVRHELITLPYFGIFDNLEFSVDDHAVTLMGQVMHATLKSNAESAIAAIEGVESVQNDIEVLPNSAADDQIRLLAFRSIYCAPRFFRYAIQAVPPIHIIVKDERVTLEGTLATESDRSLVYVWTMIVPGVSGVTNRIYVEPDNAKAPLLF